jgi:hypothetical protein
MNGENLSEFAEKFKHAVVLISTFNKGGKFLKDIAGFFVNNKGELITDEFGIQDTYFAVVRTACGDEYDVNGIISKGASLVKIVADAEGKKTPFVKLCTTLPNEGERVLVISAPLTHERVVLEGVVSSLSWWSTNKVLQIKAVNSRWLNGSPVFNMNGQVVGVATLIWWSDGHHPNFCVPAKAIKNLKRHKVQTLSEWNEGILSKSARSSAINRGDFYMLHGHYHEAIEEYKRAGEVKIPRVHYNMGLAYQFLGRHKETIEEYKKAINLKPKWIKAHYNLGINYLLIGNREAALNQYSILEKLDFISANQLLGLIYNMDMCLGNA